MIPATGVILKGMLIRRARQILIPLMKNNFVSKCRVPFAESIKPDTIYWMALVRFRTRRKNKVLRRPPKSSICGLVPAIYFSEGLFSMLSSAFSV